MRKKDYVLSIILNAFLGYLWILFIDHIVGFANSMEIVFLLEGIIILTGTFLFFEIVKRITPFNEYKNTHPIKLAGFTSFLLVVITSVLI